MAAAHAALLAVRTDGLIERAAEIGAELLARLREAADPFPHLVREVRGVGLLIGLDFAGPGLAGEMIIELIDRHVLVNHSLNADTVLRLTPPAVLTAEEVDLLVTAIDEALGALAQRYPTAAAVGGN
jgi:putrescine aminotransferase